MTNGINPRFIQDLKDRNVVSIARRFFKVDLTPSQAEIVRIIAFAEHKRVVISAMTRYGKSMCVAIGICIYLFLNNNKKVALIAPKESQASILRNYITGFMNEFTPLHRMAMVSLQEGEDRLNREASRKRITFRNGSEFQVFSAQGDADRLLGFGADFLVLDESCLIDSNAHAKIMRMLGDDAENSVMIELCNPWTRDNKTYEHWIDPTWKHIHIDYKVALTEGRVTQAFIDEMRKELNPIEFTVLYESVFPDQTETGFFDYGKVMAAVSKEMPMTKVTKKIIGCDVAGMGLDYTVIYTAYYDGFNYKILNVYSMSKTDNVQIQNKIKQLAEEFSFAEIYVDCIGIGWGVYSNLKNDLNHNAFKVYACNYAESAQDTTKFKNLKAQMFNRLKTLIDEGRISIPNNKTIIRELLSIKYEYQGSQLKIIDPDKSPDFVDALVYTVWEKSSSKGFTIA